MVCTPVDGTRYVIAATTYLDELTQDIDKLYDRSIELTRTARKTAWIILAVTLLLVGAVVSIYGHHLTKQIQSLTDVADRISVGELDAQIPKTSKDEIGDLAEAIARMQDSIRLSIERLRRRR
jgi:HAMP domain-containing protein